jgi:DNA mismatch repair protein MutS2
MQSRLHHKIEELKNERGIDFIDEINNYRKEITERIKGLQNNNENELEKFKLELNKFKDKVSSRLKKDRKNRFFNKNKPFDQSKAKPGDLVFIVSLEKTVKIDDIDIQNQKATVILGNSIKAKYNFDDLLTPLMKSKNPKPVEHAPKKAEEPADFGNGEIPRVFQTQYNTIDLRGLKVDEAITKLESDLDRMMRNNVKEAVVIHGHGTGALKRAVREQLKFSHYVKSSRAGEYGEGGDGVVIVMLKD